MTAASTLERKAAAFAALHAGPRAFILANAWDAVSARIFERAGYPAIGTTSSGLAAALGHPDGEAVSRESLFRAVERIVKAVELPVSVDIESGYGESLEALGETVATMIELGAVGVNLEDVVQAQGVLYDLDHAVERVRAARHAADRSGIKMFINARTDIFLLGVGEPQTRLPETLRRAKAFLAAGADGIFVPGVVDTPAVTELVKGIPAPLNILCGPRIASLNVLSAVGVRRVSLGSWAMRSTMGYLDELARDLQAGGDFAFLQRPYIPFAEMNALFTRP